MSMNTDIYNARVRQGKAPDGPGGTMDQKQIDQQHIRNEQLRDEMMALIRQPSFRPAVAEELLRAVLPALQEKAAFAADGGEAQNTDKTSDAGFPLLYAEMKEDLEHVLKALCKEGLLAEGRIRKRTVYGRPRQLGKAVGYVQMLRRSFFFVRPADGSGGEDIYVPVSGGRGASGVMALPGDKVLVKITAGGQRPEGKVEAVLEKGVHRFVGTVIFSKNTFYAVPDKREIVSLAELTGDLKGACIGDRVLFELTGLPQRQARRKSGGTKQRRATTRTAEAADRPEAGKGRILEVIGQEGTAGVEITAIVKSHGLRDVFPESVTAQANAMIADMDGDSVSRRTIASELARGRRDLRELRIVTIDAEDTKDVDDGVSIEQLENGNYRLGVHIADVSYYVTEGSPLDMEAYARGTSVYLADRVLPMLPKALSNGICSLNVGADRLAFSVFMELTPQGEVLSHEICESIIRVAYKITYNQLYRLFDGEAEATPEQHAETAQLRNTFSPYIEDLSRMKMLAERRNQLRVKRGSLHFNLPETKVVLDEQGAPVEVKPYPITFANNIIEEFMLACNETVAAHFFWLSVPFMYRNHGDPDPEKLENLWRIVKNAGHSLKGKRKIHVKALQDMLDAVKGTPSEQVISMMALRSMQKAEYSGENQGHFGLAAQYYTHFTSPIRRYPDLFIHRIMKLVLRGELDARREAHFRSIADAYAAHCSETERTAEAAERESVDYKVTEYMKQFEGNTFEGVISGITSFGLFIRLENTAEGLIGYRTMRDHMIYDEGRMMAYGEHSGVQYHIGDRAQVILAHANVAMRQLDFEFAEECGTIKMIDKKRKPRRKE